MDLGWQGLLCPGAMLCCGPGSGEGMWLCREMCGLRRRNDGSGRLLPGPAAQGNVRAAASGLRGS